MSERLFDQNDKYDEAANRLDREVYEALRPILNKWVEEGYSRRDIFTVMVGAASELMLCSVIVEGGPV